MKRPRSRWCANTRDALKSLHGNALAMRQGARGAADMHGVAHATRADADASGRTAHDTQRAGGILADTIRLFFRRAADRVRRRSVIRTSAALRALRIATSYMLLSHPASAD